jgi:hypothetical protein
MKDIVMAELYGGISEMTVSDGRVIFSGKRNRLR